MNLLMALRVQDVMVFRDGPAAIGVSNSVMSLRVIDSSVFRALCTLAVLLSQPLRILCFSPNPFRIARSRGDLALSSR